MHRKGFSLLELIIVLVIISLLTICLAFKWSRDSVVLDAQAELLMTDLRYAQNLAMTKHQKFSLVKISSSSYQIQDDLRQPVLNSLNQETRFLAKGISFGDFQLINNRIIFNSEGVPYSDEVESKPISIIAKIPLVLKNRTVYVNINPETGMVGL